MKAKGVDFILCPAYVGAGVLQGGAKYWNYTAIWNILDQPASILPSGLRVDKNIDKPEEAYTPRNQQDEEEWKALRCVDSCRMQFFREVGKSNTGGVMNGGSTEITDDWMCEHHEINTLAE
ncbi:hypothetical protein COL26b_006702 [Colletotrichum chrysophilum]|uniref:uncharacterized protein n=1 Tax=Colletotrichum chrysophilum TaxID=1836956 RepID=UPI0023012B01|nr:uncharacterized protein COL26b_006702 [Colletotrichum chrysophilum]KAJ0375154.1 hypothetical protein COL26b_006702 [Colletotrichum chrysophilum]